MKSLLTILFFGSLIALAGAFCEMWSLPYFTNLPTYRTLGQARAESMASKVQSTQKSSQVAPFANAPSAESNRRNNEMQKAQEQINGR